MRKNFTGPVWVLVAWGALQLLLSFGTISLVVRAGIGGPGRVALFVLSMLMWPMVIFGEALVYWLIRKRNRAQMLSWTHVVVLCTAFLVNLLISMLRIMHEPIVGGLGTKYGRILTTLIPWALIIVAHVAFVQVLVLAFRKAPPLTKMEGESENILDDVVL